MKKSYRRHPVAPWGARAEGGRAERKEAAYRQTASRVERETAAVNSAA